MDSLCIYKYKNLNINKFNISDTDIKYNNNSFYIQGPIFTNYQIINCNDKKYIEINIKESKLSHLKFITLIDALEIKINNYINKNIKTQIITNIQNKKSLKVKFNNSTIFFNSNKEIINNLYSNKISILFKLEFNKLYYSWVAIQILQLN